MHYFKATGVAFTLISLSTSALAAPPRFVSGVSCKQTGLAANARPLAINMQLGGGHLPGPNTEQVNRLVGSFKKGTAMLAGSGTSFLVSEQNSTYSFDVEEPGAVDVTLVVSKSQLAEAAGNKAVGVSYSATNKEYDGKTFSCTGTWYGP